LEYTTGFLEFSPVGRYVAATGSHDFRIWDTSNWSCIEEFDDIDGETMHWSPDGKTLVLGGEDSKLRVYDIEERRTVKDISLRSSWEFDGFGEGCFNGDGGRYITYFEYGINVPKIWDQQILVFETSNWEVIKEIDINETGHPELYQEDVPTPTTMVWDENGDKVIIGDTDGYIWSFDIGDMMIRDIIRASDVWITDMDLKEDRYLAIGSTWTTHIIVLDLTTHEIFNTTYGQYNNVQYVDWKADSFTLASTEFTGLGGYANIWDFDSDNDGSNDFFDSFPDDPSASIDTDGDGYPDYWNEGQSAVNSTTGLKLDKYPDDPERWEEEEAEKSGNFPVILVSTLITVIIFTVVFLLVRINRKRNYER
jgi:WD40 repeat protein